MGLINLGRKYSLRTERSFPHLCVVFWFCSYSSDLRWLYRCVFVLLQLIFWLHNPALTPSIIVSFLHFL